MSDLNEVKSLIKDQAEAWEAAKKADQRRDEEIKKLGGETAETKGLLERITADLDRATDERKALELAMKRTAGGFASEEEAKAAEAKDAEVKAFDKFLRKGDKKLTEVEEKALTVNSESDGGFLVTADMSGQIAKRIYETSPMRQIASVQVIGGPELEGITDIDEAGFAWETEEQVPGDDKTPRIGKWRIPTHEMRTSPQISQKLLEDANIDVSAWLVDKVADRFSRGQNAAFVNGDGSGKPNGFLTYDAGTAWGQIEQRTSGAAAGNIQDEDLVSLVYGLKGDYRANGTWVMSRKTQGTVRLFKATNGTYYWQPSYQAGQPDRLLGFPVVEFNDMPDVAAGSLSVGFGDFRRGYQVVDRVNMSVLVDPYSNKPMVEYYVRSRVGGAVINFEAIKLLKTAS